MRERKKSDASGLHIHSSRRGHFIDFRITFHVAQLAEFSGCVTAEKDFFSGGVCTTRKAQGPKVVVLEVPSKLPPTGTRQNKSSAASPLPGKLDAQLSVPAAASGIPLCCSRAARVRIASSTLEKKHLAHRISKQLTR